VLGRQHFPLLVVLVGILTVVGPPMVFDTSAPEEFPVEVERAPGQSDYEHVSYGNLSETGQRAFRRALENDGSATVIGTENVPPEFERVVEITDAVGQTPGRVVVYEGDRYLMQMYGSSTPMSAIIAPLVIFVYGVSMTVVGLAFLGRDRTVWGDIVLSGYLAVAVAVLAIGTVDATQFLEDGWFDTLSGVGLIGTAGAVGVALWRFVAYWYED
jgi:hypothetical protein